VEEDAETEDKEREDVQLLSISGKQSGPGSGSKVPQKKIELAADEEDGHDFDGEETEAKAPVKKSICTPGKNAQKSNKKGKDSKLSIQDQNVKKKNS
jgi:hypothetical protein